MHKCMDDGMLTLRSVSLRGYTLARNSSAKFFTEERLTLDRLGRLKPDMLTDALLTACSLAQSLTHPLTHTHSLTRIEDIRRVFRLDFFVMGKG